MGESSEESGRRVARSRRGLAIATAGLLVLAAACTEDSGGDGEESTDSGSAPAEEGDLLGPEDLAEGDPVRIGMVSDGATDAFDNTDELRSAEATAEYWNTHRGGIGGRPIEVVPCETGATPEGAAQCANQFVEDEVVAVALSQSGVAEMVWVPLHEAGIPTLFFQANAEDMLADTETSFVMVNPLATLFGLPLATAEAEETDTVAFINIDVPQALTAFESGEADAIFENAGLEYELIRVPPGTADMTTQVQQVVDSGAGVAHIIGNDSFCIAAINGLTAVGYEGAITSISQCITDNTREGVTGGALEGVSITSTMAVGAAEDPAYQLYEAVLAEYSEIEDVENALSMGAYTAMASLATALGEIEGDITPETAAEAIKAMPESDFPGADGMTFQCGGTVFPEQPAVCSNQSLRATLDADGNPTTYEPVDPTDILP